MISRVLIANRGEIALRVIRACREMGIETVAVYSEADRDAPYLRLADRSICIGPAPAAKSYLDISRMISAAEVGDVDAVHPGYGFLAENPHFAEVCQQCNITFIGPSPEAMRLAGDKILAKDLARKLKIPVVPGSDGPVKDENVALELAHRFGYPVILKAAGGGGGRGMRVSRNDVALVNNFRAAQAEAAAAFKNDTLYIEKYLERTRHVEIQVLADQEGRVIHLGERDCSIQRRHQKILEEAPSPAVSPGLRKDLGEAAIAFTKAAKYAGAGTVEFLLDDKGRFYFIEMNARVQVEHPVTEMVTGIDIVKEQLRIASGEKLGCSQKEVRIEGHAMECRINAEDPSDGFRPCPGRITLFSPPGGPNVRVDTHLRTGCVIPPQYDSLAAKLIGYGRTRAECLATTKRALGEFVVEGVKTTVPLHLAILENAQYIRGDVDTSFLETFLTR